MHFPFPTVSLLYFIILFPDPFCCTQKPHTYFLLVDKSTETLMRETGNITTILRDEPSVP